MPELTAQPCVLVFVIVILLVGVAALLLRLDEVDRFHNGRRSNEWRCAELLFLSRASKIMSVEKPCIGEISQTTFGFVSRSRRYESSSSSVHERQSGYVRPTVAEDDACPELASAACEKWLFAPCAFGLPSFIGRAQCARKTV